MKTCEKCEYYHLDEVSEEVRQRTDKDGFCEMRECMVNGDEIPCRRFCERYE